MKDRSDDLGEGDIGIVQSERGAVRPLSRKGSFYSAGSVPSSA